MTALTQADLPTLAVEQARSMIGICEGKRNNYGAAVERIQRRAGGEPGQNWCYHTVYTAYDIAAQQHGLKNPLTKTGRCWYALAAAMLPSSHMSIIMPRTAIGELATVKAGDVAIHAQRSGKSPGESFPGHAGITTEDLGSRYRGVEGNTFCGNLGRQYDGHCICEKVRPKRGGDLPVVAFLRMA